MPKKDIRINFPLDYVRAQKIRLLQEHTKLSTDQMLSKCIDVTFSRTAKSSPKLNKKFTDWLTQTVSKDLEIRLDGKKPKP